MKARLRLAWTVSLITDVVLLDQISKWLALQATDVMWTMNVGLLQARLALSRNAVFAFSIPAPTILIHAVVALILGAVVFLYAQALKKGQPAVWGFALILGGAFGNVIDRLWRGGVIDWIEVSLGHWTWSSFNIADVAIVLGVILTLYLGRDSRGHSADSGPISAT